MQAQQPRDVTYEGGSVQITLRNAGCARIANAFFLLVWLAAWGYGELISARVLLAFLGYTVDLPFQVPVENLRPKETAILIVAIWLAFWTWIGVSGIVAVLRTLFGRDVIELATGEWRVTRHIGPFGTTRTFSPSDGWSATLRDSQQLLTARRANKTVVVSRLGTVGERAWVRDEIAKRFPQPASAANALPAGYTARAGEPGGLVITRDARSRRGSCGCVVIALVWNVPLWWWLAYESEAYIPIGAIVIGALFALVAIWIVFANESWLLAPNLYEHRLGMFGLTHTTRISNAKLVYEESRDSDGDWWRRVYAIEPTGRKKQIHSSMNDEDQAIAWRELIARETGWRTDA